MSSLSKGHSAVVEVEAETSPPFFHHYISKENPSLLINIRPGLNAQFENHSLTLDTSVPEDKEIFDYFENSLIPNGGLAFMLKVDMEEAYKRVQEHKLQKASRPLGTQGGLTTTSVNSMERAALPAEIQATFSSNPGKDTI